MSRIEEVTELLVRLVVAAGRKIDDPAGMPRLREHPLGLRTQRDALDIADPGIGAGDVAPVGEVDRLAHVGGREVERLPGLDPEPAALVEVGGHGLQRPEMDADRRRGSSAPGRAGRAGPPGGGRRSRH